jgi:hypothetical protein
MEYKIPPVDMRLLLSEKRMGLFEPLLERKMDQLRDSWQRVVYFSVCYLPSTSIKLMIRYD